MTAQELSQYSHEPFRTELLAGRLVEMEPAGALHGAVAARICGLLVAHVLPLGLGTVFGAETGYVLATDPDTVRAPDASFVSRERVEANGGIPKEFWPGPPDIAFEVVSPRDRRRDVEAKSRSWLEAGTRAVVELDPQRRTATVRRSDGSTRIHEASEVLWLGDLLAQFAPALADVFG